jgi:hypothetical protein
LTSLKKKRNSSSSDRVAPFEARYHSETKET